MSCLFWQYRLIATIVDMFTSLGRRGYYAHAFSALLSCLSNNRLYSTSLLGCVHAVMRQPPLLPPSHYRRCRTRTPGSLNLIYLFRSFIVNLSIQQLIN